MPQEDRSLKEQRYPTPGVTEAIQHLEVSVVKAMGATKNIDATDVTVAVFVALLGAFSAYLFNYIHWRTTLKRERLSAHLGSLMSLISSFEAVAVSYWVTGQSSQSLEAEVMIKARHRAIVNQCTMLRQIQLNGFDVRLNESLRQFSEDVYDAATGDSFESTTRLASSSTAMRIAILVADIQALLSRHRY